MFFGVVADFGADVGVSADVGAGCVDTAVVVVDTVHDQDTIRCKSSQICQETVVSGLGGVNRVF